jgi:hypothetical protein
MNNGDAKQPNENVVALEDIDARTLLTSRINATGKTTEPYLRIRTRLWAANSGT